MKHKTIAIATDSEIVALGLHALISRLKSICPDVIHIRPAQIAPTIRKASPAALIIDTSDFAAVDELKTVKTAQQALPPIIGFYHSALPDPTIRLFDAMISIYDDSATVESVLKRTIAIEPESGASELTPREKEVIKGIVKGQSNKEIAQEINVSVNTVMTHRRNIAQKLRIHSPAGLTIFAIVSKIVSLDEIKGQLPSVTD